MRPFSRSFSCDALLWSISAAPRLKCVSRQVARAAAACAFRRDLPVPANSKDVRIHARCRLTACTCASEGASAAEAAPIRNAVLWPSNPLRVACTRSTFRLCVQNLIDVILFEGPFAMRSSLSTLLGSTDKQGVEFYGSTLARPAMIRDETRKTVTHGSRENAVNGLLGGIPGARLRQLAAALFELLCPSHTALRSSDKLIMPGL